MKLSKLFTETLQMGSVSRGRFNHNGVDYRYESRPVMDDFGEELQVSVYVYGENEPCWSSREPMSVAAQIGMFKEWVQNEGQNPQDPAQAPQQPLGPDPLQA